MSRRVAFLIPCDSGCMDTATGETYESVQPVKENAEHVVFNIIGHTND